MKYQLVVLPSAQQDARTIDDFLTEKNPAAAERFFEDLQATLVLQASLSTPGSPWISTNPALFDLRWTRVKNFHSYLLFLRLRGTVLELVRILHASRDLDSELSP